MFNVFVALDVGQGREEDRDFWDDVIETSGGARFRFDLDEGAATQWGNVS
ncbi:hypothetical protein [Kaarinaea lacus]